jgi:hypothetical protein
MLSLHHPSSSSSMETVTPCRTHFSWRERLIFGEAVMSSPRPLCDWLALGPGPPQHDCAEWLGGLEGREPALFSQHQRIAGKPFKTQGNRLPHSTERSLKVRSASYSPYVSVYCKPSMHQALLLIVEWIFASNSWLPECSPHPMLQLKPLRTRSVLRHHLVQILQVMMGTPRIRKRQLPAYNSPQINGNCNLVLY